MRVKNTRIQTVLASKKTLPTVLIVSENEDTAILVGSFLKDICRIVKSRGDTVPLLPCDYLILIDIDPIPSNCETVVRKCTPKVCYISSSGENLSKPLIKQLRMLYTFSSVLLYTGFLTKDAFRRHLFSGDDVFPVEEQQTEPVPSIEEKEIIREDKSLEDSTTNFITVSAPLYIQKRKLSNHKPLISTSKHVAFQVGTKTKFILAMVGIFFLLALPLLYTVSATASGFLKIKAVMAAKNSSQFPYDQLFTAQSDFTNARTMLTRIAYIAMPIADTPIYSYADHSIALGDETIMLLLAAQDTLDIGNQFMNNVTTADTTSPETSFQALMHKIPELETRLGHISSHVQVLGHISVLNLPPFIPIKSRIDSLHTQIQYAQSILPTTQKFLSIIPSFIGLEDSKRYLVLFQNNMELRPGGGFIGSYAIADFKKGHLQKLQVEDIYTADGQLKGHVDPPKPISTYLEQPHWYMRDSNFDPDFSVSAQQAEWFLEKETGIQVDGTIAIDLTAVKYILDALGGIQLSDYNETITSDNLFLKAQSEIHTEFFPGSTKKRDLLATLARNILTKFTTSPSLPYISLGRSLLKALDEKHIILSLHDADTQAFFDDSGWNGTLALVECINKQEPCTPDYFNLSEANLGVNKSNAFLDRSIEQTLVIERGHIRRDVLIKYVNSSEHNTFPGGDYRSYTRALIPSGANLESVFIDENAVTTDIMPYQDKKSVGFFVIVPSKQERIVHIRYTLPMNVDAKDYQLYIQKQPGTESDNLTISIQSEDFSVLNTNFGLERKPFEQYNKPELNDTVGEMLKGTKLTHTTDLSVDRLFRFSIK